MANKTTTPVTDMNAPTKEPWDDKDGLNTCALARPEVVEITIPAVSNAIMKMRAIVPKNSPMIPSVIMRVISAKVAGGVAGMYFAVTGIKTKLSTNAVVSLTRWGTKESPIPGMIMAAVPKRTNVRRNAKMPVVRNSCRVASIGLQPRAGAYTDHRIH